MTKSVREKLALVGGDHEGKVHRAIASRYSVDWYSNIFQDSLWHGLRENNYSWMITSLPVYLPYGNGEEMRKAIDKGVPIDQLMSFNPTLKRLMDLHDHFPRTNIIVYAPSDIMDAVRDSRVMSLGARAVVRQIGPEMGGGEVKEIFDSMKDIRKRR